ncbi:MAG: ParA family protein [Pseudomonadota bacterium]|nr:ParA family protein [Pseudomonadota bacterium]
MRIAVLNPVASVGKTTVATNLAASLAIADQRVLLIYATPTAVLDETRAQHRHSLSDVLTGKVSFSQALVSTPAIPNLDMVSGDYRLWQFDYHSTQQQQPMLCLERELHKIAASYDFIVIDSPSSLGMLTLNALVAARGVIIPVAPANYVKSEVQQVIQVMAAVRKRYNQELGLLGVLLNNCDHQNQADKSTEQEVQNDFGVQNVFARVIAKSSSVVRAGLLGMPVLLHDAGCVGAQSFLWLAQSLCFSR